MNDEMNDINENMEQVPMESSSLGLGEAASFAPDNPGFGIAGSRRNSRQTLILVGTCLLCFGAIGMFALRHRPADASAKEEAASQLDRVLQKIGADKSTEQLGDDIALTDALIQGFYEYPSNRQVSLDSLQKNPFLATTSLRLAMATASKQTSKTESSHIKEMTDIYAQLTLTSIVQGNSDSQCMINGEVFRLGDRIANVFMVQHIGRNQVVLTAQDCKFVLEI